MRIRLLLFLIFLYSSQILFAGTTGKISGKIIDAESGIPLPGANIVILNTNLGTSSDADGNFYIIQIPPGAYDVKVSYISYQTIIQKGVTVNVDKTTRLNFELSSEDFTTDVVEVVAQKDAIVWDLTASSETVDSKQIENLPVEDFQDILSLQAGVTKDAGGGLHIRGGRSSEVSYMVDGVAVSNPFGGGIAVPVQNNMIKEMEVISGTFNAEYGSAMSGIVNIVTKEGGSKTNASLSVYGGDFITTNDDVYLNINEVNPLSQRYIEGTIDGPIPFFNDANYFLSARYISEENWLYGKRNQMPSDTGNFSSTNSEDWVRQSSGDGEFVAMNPRESFGYQAKLTFLPFNAMKMSYNLIADMTEWKDYNHHQKYNPNYIPTNYSNGFNHLFSATHTLSNSTFHSLRLSYFSNDYERRVGETPFDQLYKTGIHQKAVVPSDVFAVGGVDPNFTYRKSNTLAVKYEITSQVHNAHLVKAGFVYRQHELEDEAYAVRRDEGTNWQLKIDDVGSFAHSYYKQKPIEFAAFIQDKIEIEDFVINAGVRFDYFDANSRVPVDMTDPSNKKGKSVDDAYRKVDPKVQISPRLGLAFPITDQGVIHASYGQFFQMPEYGRLYENPHYNVIGRFESFIGNADLEAQRTAIYEIGLQQKIASNLVFDITAYYKDYRHLAGSQLFKTFEQDDYGQYTNRDFGYVWGFTIALDLLKTGLFSANLDYTYQIADGNGSDPKQAFYSARNDDETNKWLVPLAWDQRHVLNSIVAIADESWGINTIFRFNSGLPYTPITSYNLNENTQLQNSGRRKPDFFVDIKLYKDFYIANNRLSVFVKVENLLDQSQDEYYPVLTQRDLRVHEAKETLNSLYEYRFNPASQPQPRLIKLGFTLNM